MLYGNNDVEAKKAFTYSETHFSLSRLWHIMTQSLLFEVHLSPQMENVKVMTTTFKMCLTGTTI